MYDYKVLCCSAHLIYCFWHCSIKIALYGSNKNFKIPEYISKLKIHDKIQVESNHQATVYDHVKFKLFLSNGLGIYSHWKFQTHIGF